jgi:hypothetical protein
MTQSKHNAKEELRKVQKEWYEKLSESGFDDIEWFNPNTGKGHNSPYLKRGTNLIRRRMNNSTSRLYRLFQHFLMESGFLRPKMPRKRLKLRKNARRQPKKARTSSKQLKKASTSQSRYTTASLKDYNSKLSNYFNQLCQAELALKYCQGMTMRDISAHMRSQFTVSRLDLPSSKRLPAEIATSRHITWLVKGLRPKQKSFSLFWVHYNLSKLLKASTVFNLTHEQGLVSQDEEHEDESIGEFMESNTAVGI